MFMDYFGQVKSNSGFGLRSRDILLKHLADNCPKPLPTSLGTRLTTRARTLGRFEDPNSLLLPVVATPHLMNLFSSFATRRPRVRIQGECRTALFRSYCIVLHPTTSGLTD